jgi:glucosamine--fructose-6-phosphate aminotransferase (isomerizing)
MCGIVGAVAQRNVIPILLEGLKRLEYRGYDSAGMAIIDEHGTLHFKRTKGKVAKLVEALKNHKYTSHIGIAHTRWATHGVPCERNAHPQISANTIAVVHNGIIENYQPIREQLKKANFKFTSDTDTEIIPHLIYQHFSKHHDFLAAVRDTVKKITGAYALGIINQAEPNRIIAVRSGSPLVIGLGIEEYFLASDMLALLPVTQRFIFLEDGDMADITPEGVTIYAHNQKKITRPIFTYPGDNESAERGKHKHFMQKEIFEQPAAIYNTLFERISHNQVLTQAFGIKAEPVFSKIERVQIVACGTSYHAGLTARYWLEGLAGIPCQTEIASEIRYRETVVQPNTLFVTISQSGETMDTLAALRQAKELGYKNTLAICNVPQSSLVRESDLAFLTKAGPEIGVASTKAFTTQLIALMLLTIALGKNRRIDPAKEKNLVQQLNRLPELFETILDNDAKIKTLAESLFTKQHALFLGRGALFPIAMEGALKLKELSYIHAEGYPAGELKHGPLALIDREMPVIVIAPNNDLLPKLLANIQEVRARGGKIIVFADHSAKIEPGNDIEILPMPKVEAETSPMVYTVPLQLLAYHVAVLKGTDVDQPRNLAKSVTVE